MDKIWNKKKCNVVISVMCHPGILEQILKSSFHIWEILGSIFFLFWNNQIFDTTGFSYFYCIVCFFKLEIYFWGC